MANLTVGWDYDEHGAIGWRWRIDEPPTRGGLPFADREQAREAGRIFADWIGLHGIRFDGELELAHG